MTLLLSTYRVTLRPPRPWEVSKWITPSFDAIGARHRHSRIAVVMRPDLASLRNLYSTTQGSVSSLDTFHIYSHGIDSEHVCSKHYSHYSQHLRLLAHSWTRIRQVDHTCGTQLQWVATDRCDPVDNHSQIQSYSLRMPSESHMSHMSHAEWHFWGSHGVNQMPSTSINYHKHS